MDAGLEIDAPFEAVPVVFRISFGVQFGAVEGQFGVDRCLICSFDRLRSWKAPRGGWGCGCDEGGDAGSTAGEPCSQTGTFAYTGTRTTGILDP